VATRASDSKAAVGPAGGAPNTLGPLMAAKSAGRAPAAPAEARSGKTAPPHPIAPASAMSPTGEPEPEREGPSPTTFAGAYAAPLPTHPASPTSTSTESGDRPGVAPDAPIVTCPALVAHGATHSELATEAGKLRAKRH